MDVTNKRIALTALMLLATMILLRPETGEAQTAERPLTLEQVERLVESGVTNSRIVSLAARNKLAFRVDQRAEDRLRSVGADEELIEGLRGIVVVESKTGSRRDQQVEPEEVGTAASSEPGSVKTAASRGPVISATGAALLSIPLPGIPLMTRRSPGPLVGLGILGVLGYLAWDLHGFHEDREAFNLWDGVGEAPLDMTVEEADSIFDAKASTLVGAYIAQVFLTYFLWEELTPHPATIQPFMVADPRALRLRTGVRVHLPRRAPAEEAR